MPHSPTQLRRSHIAICAALLVATALSGCGSSRQHAAGARPASSSTTTASLTTHQHRSAAAGPLHFSYTHLYALPAPLRDPAYAALGAGRFALIGGLDASDVSTSEIDLGGLHGISQVASIGLAQHDAQAAVLNQKVYVFGGGSATELAHIFSFDPATHQIATVGNLPTASSDSTVAQRGSSAYIVGGYDGTSWLDTVLAYTPGQTAPRVLAHLPIGLRYAAVAVSNDTLVVIGGTTSTGVSRAVYGVDLSTGQVRTLAQLPEPVCHGEAVAIGRYVYLIGGRGDLDTSQTAAILAIDPVRGTITSAGTLPSPLSDAAVVPAPNGVLVIGGLEASGTVNDNVGVLRPR